MLPCTILKDTDEVEARLREHFGLGRVEVMRIALGALAARNDSVAFDPRIAKGLLAYIYGVRTLREVCADAGGYEPVSHYNIESAYNAARSLKIMFQTADCTCIDGRDPKAISAIGPAKELFIKEASTGFLFPEMEKEREERLAHLSEFDRAEAWYVYVAFPNNTVTCELSRPLGVTGGQFSNIVERIFILGEGDLGPSGLLDFSDEAPASEIKPVVSKK
ncbi:MAG: hypothetical protein Q7V31_04965 [Parvibaculum sp.]|uniref:hypothetical protein n=1 Tax=Parvibaculum sp. TaxID=2024848 RepID=UPI00271A7AE3|nr:hypothetical protein [Parvibaculum sp.]MDO8838258.1 hypothetical protein [Parvibaculum sp.]